MCHFLDTLMYALDKALIQQSLPISNAEKSDNLFSSLFTSNVYVHTYLMLGDGDSLESTGKQGRSKGEGTESSSRTRHIDLKDRECAASSSTSSGVF